MSQGESETKSVEEVLSWALIGVIESDDKDELARKCVAALEAAGYAVVKKCPHGNIGECGACDLGLEARPK